MRELLATIPVLLALVLPPGAAWAAGQGIVATVNDQPITQLDIDQRIRLLKILGERDNDSRKGALNGLINEKIQLSEAKKYKIEATDAQINKQLERIAKGLDTDLKGLDPKLRKQGISISTLRNYISAQISFSRLLGGKYQVKIEVNQQDIDKKMAEIKRTGDARIAEIMKDPRLKPVTVYSIQEIELPLDNVSEAMANQLIQARAIEATQIIQRYNGCKNARSAASGIYNVKIKKPVDADGSRLPKPLRAALDKAGPGKAIGPGRTKNGIQLIGFCSKRTMRPEIPEFKMPTRDQVESIAYSEKLAVVEEKYMRELRKTALIEYKDPAFSQ
jgi:peptidyl-prolyl cis-trans isomerase SurA